MENSKFEVIDLAADHHVGTFETLAAARKFARHNHADAYAIWHGTKRVEFCEPYEGNDDRVKQGLGMANWSEW